MMHHMWTKPTHVWVLPVRGAGDARLLSEGDLAEVFDYYEDTGYEPKLDWLYRTMECDTVDMRDLPGLGQLWFDDNGLLRERAPSPVATALYQHCYDQEAPVVGTCILVVYPEAASDGTDDVVRRAQETLNEMKKGMN